MDNQRLRAPPTSDKSDEFCHVVVRWSNIAGERLYDVVHAEDEVICRCNRVGSADEIDILQ
jgi:hypothetical protein